MNKRVLAIIEAKKMTPSVFADTIGVPRSTISHIISGRNRPSLELISRIADSFPDINLDWVIKGKGTMFNTQTSLFDANDLQDNKSGSNLISTQTDNNKKYNLQKETDHNTHKYTEKTKSHPDKDKPSSLQKETDKPKSQEKDVIKIVLVYQDDSFEVLYPRH